MVMAAVRPEECLTRTSGSETVQGLRAPVRITRDRWGIPHIKAANVHDAFFGQGYAVAQDRLFQLELRRQMANGTAARFLNKGLLASDLLARRSGYRRHSLAEWQVQSDDSRMILEAWTAGVNAAITAQPKPYEFHLLDWEMEPWHPVDTLAIMKMVAAGNQWSTKLRWAKTAEKLGAEALLNLLPDHVPGMTLITPSGAKWLDDQHPFAQALRLQMDEPEGTVAAGGGSNCWIVGPNRSTTGAAIVCGDPHLNIRIPPEWHVMTMECPEFTVAGPCTPGAPGPLYYGHNTSIAWTMTHAGGDRWDVYRERVRRGPTGPEALYQGEWEKLERIDETFAVRDGEPVIETLWFTRHGFVCMGDPTKDDEVAAANWGLYEPGHDFDALLPLYTGKDINDARRSFRTFDSISGNFCFADRAGNIGYQYSGRIPKRPAWLLPVPGWDGTHEWDGSIAKEALPTDENPANGYIATANNRTTTDDYPHYLSFAAALWRADRIDEMFAAKDRFGLEDMPAMHGDLKSLSARDLSGRFLAVTTENPDAKAMQDLLRGWDYVTDTRCTAALVYMEATAQLIAMTVVRYYGGDVWNAAMPEGEQRVALLRALRTGDPKPLGGIPSWDAAIEQALARTAMTLRSRHGEDTTKWQWGDAHWMTWRHNLGRDPELAKVFNLPDTPVGGDGATVWATQARYGKGSDHGVSYRQIIDMRDPNSMQIVIPPGNSGQPGSPHFADNVQRWLNVEYHPLYVNWADIEANAEGTLELR